ncbi:MAG: hypothetical protein ABI566_00920 [Pseudolysinimonas sp.]
MTATPAATTTVLRPTAAAQRRTLLLSLIALPLVLLSLTINSNRQPWMIAVFAVLVGAAVLFTVLRMRRLRVEYGDGRYRHVSMYRTRDFTVADIRQVHTFTALRQGLYTNPDFMIEGLDGRRIMRLPGILWDVTLLAALAQEIAGRGIPLVVTQAPVTAVQVRSRFPHLVTWFEAHQLLAAVLIGVGTMVLVTVAIIIVFAVLFASSGLVT